ncbi:hypothetical protein NDU88_005856 [Pleurodeles waltl]|uniref:Uncharacterized protein n=1 Tax=Pleurodeles waltl TaxID=8319 RepID=A0AAV7ULB9_PLEWA|nr:hypothetical protein NDU88_005856 [Pleurodeles waltl]
MGAGVGAGDCLRPGSLRPGTVRTRSRSSPPDQRNTTKRRSAAAAHLRGTPPRPGTKTRATRHRVGKVSVSVTAKQQISGHFLSVRYNQGFALGCCTAVLLCRKESDRVFTLFLFLNVALTYGFTLSRVRQRRVMQAL